MQELAFNEDAITDQEAINASPRFAAFRKGNAVGFRLSEDADNLLSKDEVMHFVSQQLDAGTTVLVD
jgi:hypothetical protein